MMDSVVVKKGRSRGGVMIRMGTIDGRLRYEEIILFCNCNKILR
jgi:hypothetical protein